MQHAQTAHAYETSRHAVAHESRRGPAPGMVFVPCGVCLAPVDLAAVVSRNGKPPRCESHAETGPLRLS